MQQRPFTQTQQIWAVLGALLLFLGCIADVAPLNNLIAFGALGIGFWTLGYVRGQESVTHAGEGRQAER